MVMGVCFLLMVSMITSAALRQLGNYAMQHLPGLTLLQSLHQLFPLAVITTLFPAMFNYLPAKTIQWRDVRVEGPLQRSFSPSESWRGSNPSPGRRRPPRPGLPVPSPSCWGGCITPLKVSPSAQNFPKCMRAAVVHAVSTLPRADADFSPTPLFHCSRIPSPPFLFIMTFAVTALLAYEVTVPVTFILSIRVRQGCGQSLAHENLQIPPGIEHQIQLCTATGTPFDRLQVFQPGLYTIRYEATVDVQAEAIPAGTLVDEGPGSFAAAILPYLYPSRYCQSDRLGRLTYDMFGHLMSPEAKVRAVVDWISSRLTYVSGSTNAGTSAVDSLVERAGVCRDFAHLGIALCRAMNVPARYFTGYAHALEPQDFHACFETWIGGRWLFWDATSLSSPDGVVRIGTGRDASDCSVCTAFGPLLLTRQEVSCHALDSSYQKMSPEQLQATATSLEPA